MQTLTMNWSAPGRVLPALGWLLIWTSLSGCSADQTAIRVEAQKPFTAPCDGWFLSDALYQRTRQAVADRILELQTHPNP